MILRSEFSFPLNCLENVGRYFDLIRRYKVSAIMRSNDSEMIYEALEMISQYVVNETLFALVCTSKVKGNEYFALYLSYDEEKVKCRPGELFVLSKQQMAYLGSGEDYNGNIDFRYTQDIEAIINVICKALKLPFETAKSIIKSIFNHEYFDIPEFFNALERKVLPKFLPSDQVMNFINIFSGAISLSKAKIHTYNQTGCYVKEKEEYLNQNMAY